MITSIVSWVLFFACALSIFVVPRESFGSFDGYCVSIIVRCLAAMIFILIALFPLFGKNQVRRYFFTAIAVFVSYVAGAMVWTQAEARFGFMKSLLVLGILALISLVYVVFFEKRNKRHNLMPMR